eukprot:288077-Amphidinium_carterae.1
MAPMLLSHGSNVQMVSAGIITIQSSLRSGSKELEEEISPEDMQQKVGDQECIAIVTWTTDYEQS